MARQTRKSPEKKSPSVQNRAPATRLLLAVWHFLARHPRVLYGAGIFSVVFSFVTANAIWYQPQNHPSPLFAMRAGHVFEQTAEAASVSTDSKVAGNVTTFRIERPAAENMAEPATRPQADETVRAIQTELAARGLYDGPADGLRGKKTSAAILFFEETEGLEPNGEASPALLAHMRKASSAITPPVDIANADEPSPDVTASTAKNADDVALMIADTEAINAPIPQKRPLSPVLVSEIQNALIRMGYSGVTADGIEGEATSSAIRSFEKSYKLPVTGLASEALFREMKKLGWV